MSKLEGVPQKTQDINPEELETKNITELLEMAKELGLSFNEGRSLEEVLRAIKDKLASNEAFLAKLK